MTAEQCKIHAAEYQLLGREADISIRRATVLRGIRKVGQFWRTRLDRLSVILLEEKNQGTPP